MKNYNLTVTIPYQLKAENEKDAKDQVKTIIEMLGFKTFDVKIHRGNRTLSQNSALHLWCDHISQHANEMGLTTGSLFKNPAEIKITKHIIKYFIRQVGRLMYRKDSTAELDSYQFSEVVELCKIEFAKRLDYTEEFPDINVLMEKSMEKED